MGIKIDKRFIICLAKRIVIGFVITISTILLPLRIEQGIDIKEVKFGFPFGFIVQKPILTPLKEEYPIWLRFSSPWENITCVSWINFLFSFTIIFSLIMVIDYLKKLLK